MNKLSKFTVLTLVLLLVSFVCVVSVQAQTEKKLVFGFSSPTMAGDWHKLHTLYLEKTCKELGIDIVIMDGQDDEAKQISDVQSLIQLGVDALILDPIVASIGVRQIEDAQRAGIPVIAVDREPDTTVDEWDNYLCFVGPDSREGGYRIAKYLFENANVKKLLAIDGLAGSAPAWERAEGLQKALDEFPNVELLARQSGDWGMDTGMNIAMDLLTAHPDADAIWAACDIMGLGALAAIRQVGLEGKVKITSIDCVPAAAEIIKEGGDLIFTAGAHYLCASFAAVLLFDHLKGIEIPDRVEFKMLGVDKSNADIFLKLAEENDLLTGKVKSLSKFYTPDAPEDRFDKVLVLE